MDIEQQLRVALVPCRPGPAVRAAVMARVSAARGARRNPRRPVFLFTVLAIAAAAAVLVAYLSVSRQQVAVVPAARQPVLAAVRLPDPSVLPAPLPGEPAAVQVDERPDATRQVSTNSPASVPAAVDSRVLILRPLQVVSENPEVQQALREFHDGFIHSLRNVPGLVVLVSDSPGARAEPEANFRLTLVGTADDGSARFDTAINEQGEVVLRTRGATASKPATAWQMAILLEVPRAESRGEFSGTSGGPGGGMTTGDMRAIIEQARQEKGRYVTKHLSYLSGYLPSICTDPAVRRNGRCGRDAALQGTWHAEELRMQIFPADSQLASSLQARVLDAGRKYGERFDALELLSRSGGDGAMTPEVVRAGLDIAASSPDEFSRGRVLDMLRGVGQPALLQALIDMSGHGPDATTRLRALSILIADYYREDPAARKALESLAASDLQPLVRQVAARPLAYLVQTNQREDARKLLDDEVIAALVDVVPALVDEPLALTSAHSLLAMLPAENSRAVIDLLLASMDGARTSGSRKLLLSALNRRNEDPRVRGKLEKIAAEDPDPSVREQAAVVLKYRGVQGQ